MKRTVKHLTISLLTLLGTGAYAQSDLGLDVTLVEPEAGPADVVSSQTMNLQLRSYNNMVGENVAQPGAVDYTGIQQVRANYTLGLVDEAVSANFALGGYIMNDGTNQVVARRPQLSLEGAVVDQDFLALTPYSEIIFGVGQPASFEFGATLELGARSLDTEIGKLSAVVEATGFAMLSSDKESAELVPANEMALTRMKESKSYSLKESSKEDFFKPESKGEDYGLIVSPVIKLDLKAPEATSGFDLSLRADYNNNFTSKIEVAADGTEQEIFVPERFTYTELGVGYKINETLKFSNYTYVQHGGFYESRVGGDYGIQYGNLAMLSYTLF